MNNAETRQCWRTKTESVMWRAAAPALWVAFSLWPVLAAIQASADPFTVLHRFSRGDGEAPDSELVLSGSTLYGTTCFGGGPNGGTVFKINTDGTGFTVLKQFIQASGPSCLVLSGSTLYGGGGRCGVFTLSTDGTGYEQLAYPSSVVGLVLSGQTLYGTTGGSDDYGAVFSVNTDGSGYTPLKVFSGSDGRFPCDRVIVSEGMLYGITVVGGVFNYGTVFRLGTDGSNFQLLHSFNDTDGARPYAGLLLFDNMLYGLTTEGAYSFYRINPDGTGFTVLKGFSASDGLAPDARLVASGGRLFGAMAQGGRNFGLLFMVNPDGSDYTVLHYFNDDDGASPSPPLVVSGGKLYGVTHYGGTAGNGQYEGYGTVFRFSLAPPVITVGPVGQTAGTGGMVDFTVQAEGCPVLAYQWFFCSTNALPGATNSVLHLGPVLPSDSGPYTIVITNAFGAVTSAPALLDVPGGAPTILVQPSNQAVGVEATAQFSVVAGGSLPFGYQWFFNLTNILAGATGPSLSLPHVQTNQAGLYTVLVTNSFGAVTSSPVSLSVGYATVINPTETALRAAMAGGGRITFACDGTILLGRGEELIRILPWAKGVIPFWKHFVFPHE